VVQLGDLLGGLDVARKENEPQRVYFTQQFFQFGIQRRAVESAQNQFSGGFPYFLARSDHVFLDFRVGVVQVVPQ
jgi:hypothetical protein